MKSIIFIEIRNFDKTVRWRKIYSRVSTLNLSNFPTFLTFSWRFQAKINDIFYILLLDINELSTLKVYIFRILFAYFLWKNGTKYQILLVNKKMSYIDGARFTKFDLFSAFLMSLFRYYNSLIFWAA